uniref:Reverse transcriptase domain-containing protein n=1 Tax=Chromera velia CCMP2878 TaxID=1169474 RepID=A0A0G4FJA4_9ALVE|eukprot:Cvel_17319.t1-p1 / transcript=Cvel_17319.t1 / gene=Cvel_17319 / organism=Chromera_velia_CCMP2878 / gene_product=hypothetical protein / transcript_product=hypothetical protein / location=Cvel_scaffold1375:21158-23749(+) / protein_length=541 / sequence_SO=supercontig / SO=protein_coding / is_pseudo=false
MFPRRAHPLLLRGPPQSDSQSQSSGSQSPLLTLSRDNLLEAIRSVSKGSAQGVTGWRYEHLSYFLPRDGSAQARILRIATCLARGDAPVGFISLLVGGRCFALNKNAKGTEVKPIVVGDVLRRWVMRAILLEFGVQFERHLGPLQFAVHTRADTEKLFRCMQTCLQQFPSSAVLNLDASNAFNACDRQASKREYERAESATESMKLKAHHPLRQGWDAQSGCWWRAPHTQEQQRITDALHQSRRVFLFSKVGLSERVRLHSCSGNGASAWLSAIPSSGWLRFPPAVYRVALHIRLGLPILKMRRAGVCVCGSPLDPRGHHAQKCPNGGGVHWRHEQVKGAFTQILRGLRHTHVLEETTFGHLGVAMDSRLTEERNKRVDLFASLSNGDTLLTDVSVTFPISSDASRLRTRSKTAGAAAKTKSEEKVWKYAVAACAVGLWFVPLIFETFGRPDRETVSFVKELVSVASLRAGFSTEGELMAVQARLTDRYWKILGCTLQRYVAINVLTSAFHGRGQRGPFQPDSLLGREFSMQLSHERDRFV